MSDTLQRRKLTISDLRPIQRIEDKPAPKPVATSPPPKAKPQKAAKPKPPPAPPRAPGEKTAAQREKARRHHRKYRAKQIRQLSWPEINAVLAQLAERYPAVFSGEVRPLAIGIHHQILAELGCDRLTLSHALRYWVMQSAYLRAMANGTHRHGLDGAPVAELAETDRTNAKDRLRQRGQ